MSEILTLAGLARVLLYAGVLVTFGVCGAEWFTRGVESPVTGVSSLDGVGGVGERGRGRAQAAWLAILVALLLLLVAQFIALELAPTREDLAMLVRQTSWGNGWVVMCASALVGVLATSARAALPIRFVLAVAFAVAMGGVGHAAADVTPVVARTLDALHVLSIGVWIGTLLCMGSTASPRSWERFSRVAVLAAPLAVLTGAGSAFRRVGAADGGAIVASDYGRLLFVKVVIVLIIMVIGARHRAQVATRGAPAIVSVRVEVVLAMMVLLVTAVLTGTAPADE